jgi:gamma-glutamyltranspeptidase/glutathione hydrolase
MASSRFTALMIHWRSGLAAAVVLGLGFGFGLAPCEAAEPPTSAGTMSNDEAGFDPRNDRTSVRATKQMVAAANPLASAAGLEMLRAGGSAADALVAMQMVLTVVEPQSSGIGGSAFAVYYDQSSNRVSAFDGRAAFPQATTDDWFQTPDGKWYTNSDLEDAGRSVGVPGILKVLEAPHRRNGRLPWQRLFEPAIALAEQGFDISARLHASIRRDKYLKRAPAAASHFRGRQGRAKPAGARLRNPQLAATFRRIATEGADAFYKGAIAEAIAAAVQGAHHLPAQLTTADLAAYRVKERRAACVPYRVWKLCSIGATSSGATVLQMMKLIERFDLAALDPNSAEAVHLMAEARKLAWADRTRYMADPDFVPDRTMDLLDPAYIKSRSALIDPNRTKGKARSGKPPRKGTWNFAPAAVHDEHPSTSQLSAIDATGSGVTMTSSVGGNFGSRLMVGGFMLNNQLDTSRGRTHVRGVPRINRPQPGKRSRSTMSPVLAFDQDGKLILTVGSPGGGAISDYVFKTLLGVLDWSLDIQKAINLPNRVARRGRIELEKGTALTKLRESLKDMGHKVRTRKLASGIQGIQLRGGVLYGGADTRREGVALGD